MRQLWIDLWVFAGILAVLMLINIKPVNSWNNEEISGTSVGRSFSTGVYVSSTVKCDNTPGIKSWVTSGTTSTQLDSYIIYGSTVFPVSTISTFTVSGISQIQSMTLSSESLQGVAGTITYTIFTTSFVIRNISANTPKINFILIVKP